MKRTRRILSQILLAFGAISLMLVVVSILSTRAYPDVYTNDQPKILRCISEDIGIQGNREKLTEETNYGSFLNLLWFDNSLIDQDGHVFEQKWVTPNSILFQNKRVTILLIKEKNKNLEQCSITIGSRPSEIDDYTHFKCTIGYPEPRKEIHDSETYG